MTATEKPHPLCLINRDGRHLTASLGRTTESGRKLNWKATIAFSGRRRSPLVARLENAMGRNKLVAVTWEGYWIDTADDTRLTVESSGTRTVFTLTRHGTSPRPVTTHLDSFTCSSDVNGLFLTAIDPKDAFAAPLAEYLMERECPPDILAFFW